MSFGHAILVTATKFLVSANFNQMIWLDQQIIWMIQPNIFTSLAGLLYSCTTDVVFGEVRDHCAN